MEVFIAVVETGTLSQASQQTGLSLATVSRRIKLLENRLSVQLLQISSRELSLTEEGHLYYLEAKRIVSEINELETEFTNKSDKISGLISISSPTLFGTSQLMPALSSFMLEYPDIDLHINLFDREVNLIEEGIDIAIHIGYKEDSDLICKKICSLNWILAASNNYINTYGLPKSIRDLHNHKCLVYSKNGKFNFWKLNKGNKIKNIKVKAKIITNSLDCVINAALQDLGIAFVPAWAIIKLIKENTLKIVLPDTQTIQRPVYIITQRQKLSSKKLGH